MTTPGTEAPAPAAGNLTRRDFFAGAGMAAGAVATIGGIAGSAFTPAAQAAVLKDRKYFATYVALELDGAYAGNLASAEGGEPVIVPGQPEMTTGTTKTPATVTTVRYEPLRLRLGDMSAAVFKWIGDTSTSGPRPAAVTVISCDFEGRENYRLVAQEVRPISIMTDSFDASAKESLRFELTLQPTTSSHVLSTKPNSAVKLGVRSKAILRSNFRLYIKDYDSASLQIRSIEPFGLKARPDGLLVPTTLKFTMLFASAAPLFNWMQGTLAGKDGGRPAQLQILSPDLKTALATIDFTGLTILRISCPAQTGGDSFQHVEVECQPTTLTFNMNELAV
jgi:hypothetical protein